MMGRKRRRYHMASCCLMLLSSLPEVHTRTWEDVVDPSALVINTDPGRDRFVEESDPFLTTTTPVPTISPTMTASPSSLPLSPEPTISRAPLPTKAPTERRTLPPKPSARAPSIAPTAVPSQRLFDCPSTDNMYQVVMHDNWNDGWDDGQNLTITRMVPPEQKDTLDVGSNTIIVRHDRSRSPGGSASPQDTSSSTPSNTVFEGTLSEGGLAIHPVCLRLGSCYEATIPGGEYSYEIRWEIKPYEVPDNGNVKEIASIARGGAPLRCTFSTPGGGGAQSCDTTCIDFLGDQSTQEPLPTGNGGDSIATAPPQQVQTPGPTMKQTDVLITQDTLVDRGSARTRGAS